VGQLQVAREGPQARQKRDCAPKNGEDPKRAENNGLRASRRVLDIRNGTDQPPSSPQHPSAFPEHGVQVGDVLQQAGGDDGICRLVGPRKCDPVDGKLVPHHRGIWERPPGLLQHAGGDVRRHHPISVLTEMRGQVSRPAAELDDGCRRRYAPSQRRCESPEPLAQRSPRRILRAPAACLAVEQRRDGLPWRGLLGVWRLGSHYPTGRRRASFSSTGAPADSRSSRRRGPSGRAWCVIPPAGPARRRRAHAGAWLGRTRGHSSGAGERPARRARDGDDRGSTRAGRA
jgi:hypothetical protein